MRFQYEGDFISVEILNVAIEKDADTQVIIGQAGFIKTAEDLYEAMSSSVPNIKFGLAFTEASNDCLIRSEGNDAQFAALAEKNAMNISAGHVFVILFKNAFPINVMEKIRNTCEVVNLYCATANPVDVIIADTGEKRSVIGVADGLKPKGIEKDEDRQKRRKLLRDIKYKL